MSSSDAPFTRTCPQCGRRVPRRLTVCRCGLELSIEAGQPQASPAVPTTARRWPLWLAVAGVAAAGVAVLTLWPTPASRSTDDRSRRTAAVAVTEPSAASEATPAEAKWPTNVPFLTRSEPAAASSPSGGGPVPVARVDLEGSTLERVASASLAAVVLVETPSGRGTGFFISPDSALTNAHVVGGNAYVTVQSSSGERSPARVEKLAADHDIAVLRLATPRTGAQFLPLADLSRVRVGQEVLAIGSPHGLQNTVTRGIVSAVRRAGSVVLIQTDAAINPGNSGGPIVDRAGRAIGIATMKVGESAEGLGFAVAVDHARALIETGSAGFSPASASAPTSASWATPVQPDAADGGRSQGIAMYERVMADAARRADSLDDYWTQFSRTCLARAARTSGDREWFAIWERAFATDAVAPACTGEFERFRQAAASFRAALVQADEAARRADVYPGTRRELRTRYRLDWDGWDR